MTLFFESADLEMDELKDIRIKFDNEFVILSGDVYPRATRGTLNASDAFKSLNDFFSILDIAKQRAIFECYKQIDEILTYLLDDNQRIEALTRSIQELYSYIDYEALEFWVMYKSGIKLPPDLALSAYEGAAEERTYLEKDYWPLITLSLAIRPMLPIWNAYIPSMKNVFGNDFKEYQALKLLWGTWLVHCAPYERLMSYLEFTYDEQTASKKEIDFSPLLTGLSRESIPVYLMGLALVRRLAIGNLYPQKKEDSLVANIYNYIFKNVVMGLDRNFSGRIKEKVNREQQNDEDNTSVAELYKVKSKIPDGVVELQDISAENPYVIVNIVDNTVPRHYISETIKAIDFMYTGELQEHYLPLTQWCLATAITPKSIPDLSKNSQILMFAATQSLLWHWGFYHLALLITAVPEVMENDFVNIGELRSRITDDSRRQLVEIFPHYYPAGGSNPPPEEKQQQQRNVAVAAVENLARRIHYSRWISNAPRELEALAGIPEGLHRFSSPTDMRNQLAMLIIKINSMN